MRICVAENVGVRLGQATVLDDVSIGISVGEWIAIVGPNGAGKTTLLSVMQVCWGVREPCLSMGIISLGSVHGKEPACSHTFPNSLKFHLECR